MLLDYNKREATKMKNIIDEQLNIGKCDDESGLDFEDRSKLRKLLRQINGKDIDIFKNVNLDNNKNRIHLHAKSIQLRLKRGLFQNHYSNLNLVLNFRAVNKINFIQCLIKRIELAKKIFVQDIE